ncbi:MAG: hypothetical protein VKJ05_02910 [Synechococcaceae cyanobacterium]|nr:hypothetical protein [Synechococcaceae cyanobacterium]
MASPRPLPAALPGALPCRPRLRALLSVVLLAPLATLPLAPARAATPPPALLQSLEAALNASGDAGLEALLKSGPGLEPPQLLTRRRQLRAQFPDLRWLVRAGTPLRDGQATVSVKVSGTRRQGATSFRLDGEQLLLLQSDGSRINGQTVLREQSLLRSGEQAPPVSLLIPDAVLTGQRYDVDVIFDEPLDGALTAGGITALRPDQVMALESPSIELGALGGGGLFKTVQAPLTPGSQTWAVLLVHPRGVVSASKRVRVVADRRALEL